jgi:predicted DNA-binding transcriptional regulator YafY
MGRKWYTPKKGDKMANQANQKEKILRIKDMLERETDEEHPLTAGQMIKKLSEFNITAERKSIYRDVDALISYGMDILKSEDGRGTYLASRDFELPELKLLVDAVSASKFITEKKSRDLVKKIELLGSIHEAKDLHRQVVVQGRAKAENESIYYTIDTIYNCIDDDKRMQFQYFSWNENKEKELHHGGDYYEVSPAFLLWADENYYLVAYSEKEEEIRHYRVDKMLNAKEMDRKRGGKDAREKLSEASYSNSAFGMFAGETRNVTLQGASYMSNVLLDRFGSDLTMRPAYDEETMEKQVVAHVEVQVSSQFFGWLAGLGKDMVLVAPEDVREQYQEYLKQILEQYRDH